jgi:hypothetical protein
VGGHMSKLQQLQSEWPRFERWIWFGDGNIYLVTNIPCAVLRMDRLHICTNPIVFLAKYRVDSLSCSRTIFNNLTVLIYSILVFIYIVLNINCSSLTLAYVKMTAMLCYTWRTNFSFVKF